MRHNRTELWPILNSRIALKDVQALTPGTCKYITFHGKKDFADVIKVKDGKIGGFPGGP